MKFGILTLSLLVGLKALAGNESTVLEQAKSLGAPMQAVARAIKISKSSTYEVKDVIAVFDISQPSKNKRFYLLDFKKGTATAYFVAHGKSNGDNLRATHFSGFQEDHDMTPLGPLKTAEEVETMDHYETVTDKYNGRTYSDLVILKIEGTTSYNDYINRQAGVIWILHPNWYVTEGYRKANPQMLGRSLGCIVLDPAVSNAVFRRLEGGALVYVTVGDHPIEKYL